MRIVIFDGIQEDHVAESMRDALVRRGHEVRWTGQVWKGYTLPSQADDVARFDALVDDVLAWRPDALLSLRVASLTRHNTDRLRSAGVRLLAWFSDDPVLFALSTEEAAPRFDVTLHTGGEEVLALYEDRTGVRGVTMPFYADPRAFPYAYDARRTPAPGERAAIFLGNTQTPMKRWRHDVLAASGVDLAIYGRVARDQVGLHGGYLASDAEVAATLPRFAVGVSIAQRFRDYHGSAYDYPGLAELGTYRLPSRVVQMAAVGLPVVDLRTDDDAPPDVPAVVVTDADALRESVSALTADPRRRAALSREGRDWFECDYTADSRAALVEALVDDPSSALALPRAERARLFATFGRPRSRRPLRVRAAAALQRPWPRRADC